MKSSEEELWAANRASEPLNTSNAGNVTKRGWKEKAQFWGTANGTRIKLTSSQTNFQAKSYKTILSFHIYFQIFYIKFHIYLGIFCINFHIYFQIFYINFHIYFHTFYINFHIYFRIFCINFQIYFRIFCINFQIFGYHAEITTKCWCSTGIKKYYINVRT